MLTLEEASSINDQLLAVVAVSSWLSPFSFVTICVNYEVQGSYASFPAFELHCSLSMCKLEVGTQHERPGEESKVHPSSQHEGSGGREGQWHGSRPAVANGAR